MSPADFGWVIRQLKDNLRLARRGWNGKAQWIQLQKPDAHSKMSQPYIYFTTATGDRVPWVASQSDLLAEDWFIV